MSMEVTVKLPDGSLLTVDSGPWKIKYRAPRTPEEILYIKLEWLNMEYRAAEIPPDDSVKMAQKAIAECLRGAQIVSIKPWGEAEPGKIY